MMKPGLSSTAAGKSAQVAAATTLMALRRQLEANYGHHHPEFQEEAAEAFGGRR
jgi:hypothetical protein